jgi:hypothetical protein
MVLHSAALLLEKLAFAPLESGEFPLCRFENVSRLASPREAGSRAIATLNAARF